MSTLLRKRIWSRNRKTPLTVVPLTPDYVIGVIRRAADIGYSNPKYIQYGCGSKGTSSHISWNFGVSNHISLRFDSDKFVFVEADKVGPNLKVTVGVKLNPGVHRFGLPWEAMELPTDAQTWVFLPEPDIFAMHLPDMVAKLRSLHHGGRY